MVRFLYYGLLVAVLGGVATPAWADRVTDLCRLLERGSDQRVKLRAVVALGALGSIRAVASLTSALDSSAPMVRLLAARSLALVGNTGALESLERRLKFETDRGIKEQIVLGIAMTRKRLAGPPLGTRYQVNIGALHNASGKGDPELPIVLGEVIARGLDRVPSWWVWPVDQKPPEAGQASAPRRLEVRATVLDLARQRRGSAVELSCRLLVSIYAPGDKSLAAPIRVNTSINTPASGYRDSHENAFYTDLIELAGRLAVRRVVSAVSGLRADSRQPPNRTSP